MEEHQVKTSTTKRYLYSFSGIFFIILVWFIVSTIQKDDLIFPSLKQILSSIINILSDVDCLKYIGLDIIRIIIAIIVSFIVSIIVVFFYIRFKNSYHFIKPLLVFFKTIPVVGISIFIWLLVGGTSVPVITTILVTIPVIIQGLVGSLDEMDENLVNELKMVNINYLVAFFKVYLPYLVPYILISFFQTFGLGLKVMVTSEYLSQTKNSIGKALYNAQSNIAIDDILAWSIIIIVFVGVCEIIIKKLTKKLDY